MTIASRFRTVVWVAAVAVAALGCYLVSLRVASERAQVARIDARLAAAQADIRQLGTELDTRGRLVQLERWNGDVLGLTAPKASQYLSGEVQLASLSGPAAEPAVATTPAAAELMAPAEVAKVAYRRPDADGGSRLLHSVSLSLEDGGAAVLRPVALVRAGGALAPAYLGGKIRRP